MAVVRGLPRRLTRASCRREGGPHLPARARALGEVRVERRTREGAAICGGGGGSVWESNPPSPASAEDHWI